MFVRWKRRAKSRRKRPSGEIALSAYLVCSKRVEGKPRQSVVAYLGSIRESGTPYWGCQFGFWEVAAPALDRLGLDPAVRLQIEARLTEKVRKPTREELEARSEAIRLREAKRLEAIRLNLATLRTPRARGA